MKKNRIKIIVLASALMLAITSFVFPFSVYAEDTPQIVFDDAYYLDDQQYYELNQRAVEITEKYQCSVHFIITDNPDLNIDNIQEYSEDLYLSSDIFGYGSQKDGFMLVLGTVNRCYWLLAYGDYGNYALTDYGKEVMTEEFLDDFANDEWYEGFKDYLDQCEVTLSKAAEGKPIDIYGDDESFTPVEAYGIGAFIALIVSFIVCGVYKSQMKTAVIATSAGSYVKSSQVQIEYRHDRFTHAIKSEEEIKSSDDSGKGTTVNSRGFSGKGGKF